MKQPPIADQNTMRLVQRVLDEQGCVILAHTSPCEPGTVLSHFFVGKDYQIVPGPLVVIGPATEREWYAQRRKYSPFAAATGRLRPGLSFLKVVAE